MVQFGIDNLLIQNPLWKKKRIALVTNKVATTNQLKPSGKILIDNGFNIVKFFSPEHGFDICGDDGAKMEDVVDADTQINVISLYGERLQPTAKDLDNVDIVLFDIPDIGCRYYTYLWTMTHVLEACAKYQKPLFILDRPNPISGNMYIAEGPMLDEVNCASFIGRWAIPLRHGCTIGELALYFNKTKNINAKLKIIACTGWERNMFQTDWNIDFVPTSPAIRNFTSALLYPGLGLLEATNISEGRGTDFSFQVAAAPWIHAEKLSNAFNSLLLDDVQTKPIFFTPTHSKYAMQVCNGVQFMVTKKESYQPVYTALIFIKLVKNMYPNHFKWMPYITNVNPTGTNHLDKLLGIKNSEALFELPMITFLKKVEQIITVRNWEDEIKAFLLYC